MAKQSWKPGNMLYPLPAVMVSCQRGEEKPNIITLAWVGTVCTNPPMVSISVRPERYSYPIIRESGEFVINLVTEELARANDFCGVRSGRDLDKFAEMKLTPAPSEKVHAPAIAESPVNIECKVREVLELGSHHMFLADVVAVHVDETLLDEKGKLLLEKNGLVTYSHGTYYGLGEKLGTFGYSVKKPDGKVQKSEKKKKTEQTLTKGKERKAGTKREMNEKTEKPAKLSKTSKGKEKKKKENSNLK